MNDDLWIFVYNFTQLPWHLQSVWHRICVHIQADLDIFWYYCLCIYHYCDAIMGTIASEITSLTIVYTTVYSDADQSKHQSSASLAFVWGIHRDRWIPCTKGQLRGKCFHLMTSSCMTELRRAFKVFLFWQDGVLLSKRNGPLWLLYSSIHIYVFTLSYTYSFRQLSTMNTTHMYKYMKMDAKYMHKSNISFVCLQYRSRLKGMN